MVYKLQKKGIRNFEFVAKTNFYSSNISKIILNSDLQNKVELTNKSINDFQ